MTCRLLFPTWLLPTMTLAINCRNGSEPFKRTVLTVLTACLSSSIFVHSPFPSLSYFIFHLPSSTLIFLHLFSFSFIHLSLSAFINLHSPSFIFINYNSDSFTFICLHSHSFYVINFHLTSEAFRIYLYPVPLAYFHLHSPLSAPLNFIQLHLPSSTSISLHPRSSIFMSLLLPSSAYIYHHLIVFIYLHLPPSTPISLH